MMPPQVGPIDSGGESGFIGELNIYNIGSVVPPARALYRSLITIPSEQFAPIKDDLARLMGVLESIVEDQATLEVDYSQQPALRNLSKDCYEILGHLQAIRQEFDAVGSQSRLAWERVKWRGEELEEIWQRLRSTVSALNDVYHDMIQSSVKGIEGMLERFIHEVQSEQREGSIISSHSANSLSMDQKEGWRQLRKELESVGITPALFDQHRDRIVQKLLSAIDEFGLGYDEISGTAALNSDLSPDNNGLGGDRRPQTFEEMGIPPLQPAWGSGRIAKVLLKITNAERRLMAAAVKGDLPAVHQWIQRGASVNTCDERGRTPLYFASGMDNESVVKYLIGISETVVEANAFDGSTPLIIACANKSVGAVKLLLESCRTNVNAESAKGITPLWCASGTGSESIVTLLLEYGATNVNPRYHVNGTTPLWIACRNGNEGVVRLLLGTGEADINAYDSQTQATPLWWACRGGHTGIVRLLLDTHQADVNQPRQNPREDEYGYSSSSEHKPKDDYSKQFKGRRRGLDDGIKTPLEAAAYGDHDEVVELLLNCEILEYQKAFMLAVQLGKKKAVAALLGSGKISLHARDSNGYTPLARAARQGNDEVVQMLQSALRKSDSGS